MVGVAEEPSVTVLLPVFNGAAHLRQSIDSVLNQTFGDLELLVVDDGSEDETPSIVAGYGDPRLRSLRNDRNRGLTWTLNRGIREARGFYIARQDADDVSHPGRLSAQVRYLDAHPETVVLGCSYRRIDESGAPQGLRPAPTDPTSIRWRLLFLSAFAHSSVLIRREILTQTGGYDEAFRYAQDYELWSRIARDHDVAALPEPLIDYRRTASSLTATYAGADAEVESISAANVAHVLAAAGATGRLHDWDRDVAWRLLFAGPGGTDQDRAAKVAGEILELQSAFAQAFGLSPRAARAHRRRVALRLASRLSRLGQRRVSPGAAAAAGQVLLVGLTRP